MEQEAVRYLGDVQRLELKPGDVVVLTVTQPISCEAVERMGEIVRRALPEHRCLILTAGVSIGVMGGRE